MKPPLRQAVLLRKEGAMEAKGKAPGEKFNQVTAMMENRMAGELSGKLLRGKMIAVLVADQYQELEVWYPLLRFREDGATTIAVGAEVGKTYLSKKGYPVVADKSVGDVGAAAFDAVIIPGGWAPDFLRQDERMVAFVRDMHEAGKLVAAICHGGWLLCSAGIVQGRKATCFKAIKDDMIHAGAQYVDEEVAVDGNLITSRKPTDLPAFCRRIIIALSQQAVGTGVGRA
jgi:deglycase